MFVHRIHELREDDIGKFIEGRHLTTVQCSVQ